jgi:hypothetical protein
VVRHAAGKEDMDQRLRLRFIDIGFQRAQLEKIPEAQPQTADQTGEKEFATGCFAEMRGIVVPR